MNFEFLPYKLNTSLKLLNNNLKYEGSANDVDYYNVTALPIAEILGTPLTSIALYFYRKRLISAYYRLNKGYAHWEEIVLKFEAYFGRRAMCWEEDEGNLYNWQKGNQFFGILCSKADDSIRLYHTFKWYNVFDDYPF